MRRLIISAIGLMVLVGCSSPTQIVNDGEAEVVTVTAKDGRQFECLILQEGDLQSGVMGMDCKWPDKVG